VGRQLSEERFGESSKTIENLSRFNQTHALFLLRSEAVQSRLNLIISHNYTFLRREFERIQVFFACGADGMSLFFPSTSSDARLRRVVHIYGSD